MPLVVQDLRGQVLGSAAEGLGAALRVVARDARLGQTEVRDADMTRGIQSVCMYVYFIESRSIGRLQVGGSIRCIMSTSTCIVCMSTSLQDVLGL